MFKLALRGIILSLLFTDFLCTAQAGRILEEGDETSVAAPAAPAAPAVPASPASPGVPVLRRSLTAPIPIPVKQQAPMLLNESMAFGTPPLLSSMSSSPRVDAPCFVSGESMRPASASPAPITSSARRFPFGEESNGFLPYDELAGLIERREWPGTVSTPPVFGRTSTSSTSSTSIILDEIEISQDEYNGFE